MAQCASWDALREAVEGELVLLNSQASWDSFKLFNSASRPDATTSAGSSSTSSSSSSNTPLQVDLSLSSPAVLYPRTSQDVLLAVNFAHAHGLEVSVKSGGYNPSNWSTSGRLILDLKELKSVVVRPRDKLVNKPNGESGAHDGMTPTVHERSASTLSISGVAAGNSTVTNSTYTNGQATASGSATSNKRKQPTASSPGPTFAQPAQPASGALGDRNIDLVSSGVLNSGSDDQSKSTNYVQDTQMNEQDVSANVPQRAAGKRRMLDSDRSAQSSSSNGDAKMIPAIESNSDGPHYIQANAYPPFNLVNANAQQRREFHERASANENGHARAEGSSSSERTANGSSESDQPSVPFIHDPIRKSTVFPGKAPPGTIPFSTSNTPNRNNGTGDDTSTEGLYAATTTSEAAQSSAPWPRVPRPEGHRSTSNESNASSSSSTLSNMHFGAAPPEDYALVSFGSGTTAHHLDRVTATSAYHSSSAASWSDSDGKLKGDMSNASDYASNESGIECFVPWACYPVGSAIFLTGGYGFVSRLYGLSMDLVTELELVLPPGTPPAPHGDSRGDGFAGQVDGVITKGRIVHLKSDYATDPSLSDEQKREQEELWWVCRGAGTAFGIVTNITAKAFNIGQVLAGNVIFPFNPLTTPSLLKHWRDCLKVAPRELYTNVTLTAGPSEKGHVVVIQFSWCGKKVSEGESILQTILSWDGERCLLKDVEVRPYKHQQENVSQILSSKDNTRWLVRSTLLKSLSDKSIHNTVELFRASPPGCSWLFETAGEAIAEPAYPSCFPMDHRKAPFQVAALHQWTNSTDDDKQKQLAESWVYHCLKDEACGPFPCFLSSGEGRERITAVYGRENWQRIKQLKEKYDPHHVMKYNHLEEAL